MAKQGSPNQTTITSITDVQGNVIMEIRQEEYLVLENGSVTSYTHFRNITLVDGSTWSPVLLSKNPPIYIGVCETCRNPGISLFRRRRRTHGLVAMARARLCADCGLLTCPRHRRLGKHDKKWRCLACAKKHTLGNLLRPIFFERQEEDSL